MHSSGVADTLGVVCGCEPTATAGAEEALATQRITAEEMFGAQSRLIEQIGRMEPSQTLVGDVVFQILAVVMMLVVVFFVARHRHRIVSMLGKMLKGRLPDDYTSGRREEHLTRTFLHTSSFIGVMLVTLFLVKYAPVWLPEPLTPAEGWVSIVATLYVLVAIAAIWVFEYALLWVVGRVTRNEECVGAILYLKRTGFSLAAIALSPIFLLGVLSSEKLTDTWNILLFVECSLLVLLFIKETLAFFIDKKIPIFHWILYLCTVEAFPLSLIWALTIRS